MIYIISLINKHGEEILSRLEHDICKAHATAKRLVGEGYVRYEKTTHEALGTYKATIEDQDRNCLHEYFYPLT